MSKDLEQTLKELGPDYRRVVNRLRTGKEAAVRRKPRVRLPRLAPSLLAASLFLALGLFFWMEARDARDLPSSEPAPAYGAREYRLSTEEMIATQRSDGGWANDFQTLRNARALQGLSDPAARVAYKKAMRNLRLRNVSPRTVSLSRLGS